MASLSVLMGGMIYILFRSSDILAFQWLNRIGMDEWIHDIRSSEMGSRLTLPQWFIYSLPNGLWAFAYALIISSLWIRQSSWIKWVWLSTIPILVMGFEMLQYLNLLPGTFSLSDLLSGIAGIVFGVLLGIKLQKNKKYENALD